MSGHKVIAIMPNQIRKNGDLHTSMTIGYEGGSRWYEYKVRVIKTRIRIEAKQWHHTLPASLRTICNVHVPLILGRLEDEWGITVDGRPILAHRRTNEEKLLSF